MKGDAVTGIGTSPGCREAFLEGCGAALLLADDVGRIERPRDHGPTLMGEVQQVIDAVGLGLELEKGIGSCGEEGDELRCKTGERIQCQAVRELARPDAECPLPMLAQKCINVSKDILEVDVDRRAGIVLEVVLEDSSPAFDPFSRESPDDLDSPLEERDVGGLGIFLAGANVDEFRYEHVAGRNRNIFVMRNGSAES